MPTTQAKSGRAGNITVGGIVIPITKWTAKLNVEFADSTDSGNYVPASGNLYKSQLPGDQQISGSIEAYYDVATTSANITSNIKNPTNGPYALVLKFDSATTYFSGNVDLTDDEFNVVVPGATTINFTANFKSNGSYTLT